MPLIEIFTGDEPSAPVSASLETYHEEAEVVPESESPEEATFEFIHHEIPPIEQETYSDEVQEDFKEEVEEDNFILTIPESELFQEEASPETILTNSMNEVKKQVHRSELAIKTALLKKTKDYDLKVNSNNTLAEITSEVRKYTQIPYEHEVNEIERIKQRLLENPDGISLDDVKFAFNYARKFLEEFK